MCLFGDSNVVQLGLLESLLLSLQNVRDQVVVVVLRLESLVLRQQVVGQSQLMSSYKSIVPGVNLFSRQSRDCLLDNRGFFKKQVVVSGLLVYGWLLVS
jgi:hypothetical protein